MRIRWIRRSLTDPVPNTLNYHKRTVYQTVRRIGNDIFGMKGFEIDKILLTDNNWVVLERYTRSHSNNLEPKIPSQGFGTERDLIFLQWWPVLIRRQYQWAQRERKGSPDRVTLQRLHSMVKVTVHPELRYICFWCYSGSSLVQYF